MPAIGLVGRLWGDYLAKWFYLPVSALVLVLYALVTSGFEVGWIGGYGVALVIAVPLAVILAQVVGLVLAWRWALTVRQAHIMRRWR